MATTAAAEVHEAHLQQLIELGIALSAERNHDRLMEKILLGAKALTNADGGTLYLLKPERRELAFAILRNDTLGVAMGGTTGNAISFPPVPLYDEAGAPNHKNVSAHAAISG